MPSTVPCAHEFCDLEHEGSPAVGDAMCRCAICKRGPLHHPVCCADHFREQHRRPVECEPIVEPKRGLFGRRRRARQLAAMP